MPKILNEKGLAAPLLILLSTLAVLVLLLITNTFEFKDRLFSALFPKPPSQAASAQVYFGAHVTDMPGDPDNLIFFENKVKKKAAIALWFQDWSPQDKSGFPTIYVNYYRTHGSIPMISWNSWDDSGDPVNQPTFSLKKIITGNFDAYITKWAQDAKAWGHPFFLELNSEMNTDSHPWSVNNNGNTPADYPAAWKHVHDIFTKVGVTNSTWVWTAYYNNDPRTCSSLQSLYPGDSYVDWVGMNGFNVISEYFGWQTFSQLFSTTYNCLTQTIAPNKPLMIGEMGSSEEGGSKAEWIKDAFQTQIPNNFPKIKAFLWFNKDYRSSGSEDWSIESSNTSLKAFSSVMQSDFYATNSYIDLESSPILIPENIPSPSPTTHTITLNPIADTRVTSSDPTNNAGYYGDISVSGTPNNIAYLKFDLSALVNKNISSVKFRLTPSSHSYAGSTTQNIKLMDNTTWEEYKVNYNTKPSITPTILGTISNTQPGIAYETSLSPTLIQSSAGGVLSLAIDTDPANTKALIFRTRDTATPEQLIITYTDNSLTPTPVPSAAPTTSPSPTPVTDLIKPTVSITSPLNGATVARNSTLIINAQASDNVRVSKVEFYLGSSLLHTDTTAPYSYSYKLPGKRNTTYTYRARAYDSVGNVANSSPVTVSAK